ncbi:MAGE-domain-containing protein [Dothidotthia symphoricarpi CBS 119687]|uniref:MAGE-domain-containing protein n=1 Tax=Dothidotthia symphoricarpi CBS 119687 TaxID=1392245 RepID=A0A6A6A3E5_9PLEO|nr:MAGE-domain-containing protein [Dothidotthia symphoricarpi CBS 119687]KAF2125673.1 MAGE-domain-containing protein [Dothidotthia symphoricarpi CBS 119687]
MPPRTYRRRTAAGEDDGPTPTQTQRSRQQVDTPPEDVEDVDMEDHEDTGSGSLEQLSKGLVRYALSCEYARKPIRRQDVTEKVLGSHTRLFKDVFARANSELQDVFGMQMVELSVAEKVTMRQKRNAAASQSQSKSTNLWVLQTMLPDEYRIPEVMGPSRELPESQINKEDAYVGLYTMAITLIMISGGKMAEGKLDRALRRMNADQTTPLGSKDKTLAAMIKDGYIVRIKESTSGEETIDYIVGPRGKVEVGREGVARLMRAMHSEGEQNEELEEQIQRTLDAAERFNGSVPTGEASQAAGPGRKRGRGQDGDDD